METTAVAREMSFKIQMRKLLPGQRYRGPNLRRRCLALRLALTGLCWPNYVPRALLSLFHLARRQFRQTVSRPLPHTTHASAGIVLKSRHLRSSSVIEEKVASQRSPSTPTVFLRIPSSSSSGRICRTLLRCRNRLMKHLRGKSSSCLQPSSLSICPSGLCS